MDSPFRSTVRSVAPIRGDVLAVVVVLLGLIVSSGWCLHIPALVRPRPDMPPMQADTALGFVFAGLALLAYDRGRRLWCLSLAGILVAFTVLAFIEFTVRGDFGIHHWHLSSWLAAPGVQSNPMARATASLFAFFGTLLIAALFVQRASIREGILTIGGAAMLSIALLALGAKAFQIVPDPQWMREASHMAWHTVGGMLLLAIALAARIVKRDIATRDRTAWMTAQVAVCLVACALFFWQVTVAQDHAQLAQELTLQGDALRKSIVGRIADHKRAMEGMARRIEFAGGFDPARWTDDAALYLHQSPDVLGFSFADADGVIRNVVPLPGREGTVTLSLAREPRRAAALNEARSTGHPAVAAPLTLLSGRPGFLVLEAVGAPERRLGFLVAVFTYPKLLEYVTDSTALGVAVEMDGRIVAQTPNYSPTSTVVFVRDVPLGSGGWNLRVTPTPERLAQSASVLSRLVLMTGLAIAGLLTGVTFLLLREWRRNEQLNETRRQLTDLLGEQSETHRILWETTTLQQAILESANCSIISSDAAGVIQMWNATAERWLGYAAAEVVRQPKPPVIHLRQELRRRAEELTRELGQQVKPGFDALVAKARLGQHDERDWTYVRRDGTTFPVRLSVSPIRDFDGGIVGFLGVGTDMTEPMRIQRELRAARDAALAATQAKSAFLATMSHEIRTPLSGVIGLAGLLLETNLPSDSRDLARTILQSSEMLLAIINDVLDFSKIEAGRLTLEQIDLDLRAVVNAIVDLLMPVARAKGIGLEGRVDASVPDLLIGDPHRLHQILLNLVGNAIKFTPTGSVQVRVSCRTERDRALVRVEVADTGVGIAPEVRNRLFKSYAQADASTARSYGGTGLGLVISRQLTELMDGEIGLQSEEGQGSTFWFTVRLGLKPRSTTPLPASSATASKADAQERIPRMRILVAEDNPVNQRVALALLTKLGHDVTVVENGQEALDAIARAPFDLVLMDCQMPRMDGYEATVQLRTHEAPGTHLRVVALTADAEAEVHDRCLAAGMDGCLTKPVRLADLQQALRLASAEHQQAPAER